MKIKGFTLIELLVVIAIIAMLSAIIVGPIQSARAKARDAKRSADIKNIQTALSFYYDENNNYPTLYENECGGTEGYTTSGNNFMQTLVTAGFLNSYPTDPGKVNCNMQYTATTDQQGYVIFVHFESKPNTGCVGNAPYWSCIGEKMNPAW